MTSATSSGAKSSSGRRTSSSSAQGRGASRTGSRTSGTGAKAAARQSTGSSARTTSKQTGGTGKQTGSSTRGGTRQSGTTGQSSTRRSGTQQSGTRQSSGSSGSGTTTRQSAGTTNAQQATVHLPFVTAQFHKPDVQLPALPGRQELTSAAETVRAQLPEPGQALFYGGLAAGVALSLLEWPVALAIGVGAAVVGRGEHNK